MPKATRKIVTAPVTSAAPKTAKAAKPVKPAQPNTAETISPEFLNAEPVSAADTAPVAAAPAVAKPSANLTRTAATVVRHATNFAVLSDRDSAYLAFYAKLAKASVTGNVTLAGIVASGERPLYAGSNKPHDAGVIVRLTKAGLLSHAADGTGFEFSPLGRTHGAYTKA